LINQLTRYIGDESGLILDPDLDSYYLMDITLLSLPKFKTSFSNYVLSASEFLTDPDTEHSGYLRYLAKSLSTDAEHMLSALNTSIHNDSEYYGTNANLTNVLRPNFLKFDRDFGLLLKHTEKYTDQSVSVVSKNEFMELVLNVTESSRLFWNSTNAELNTLLNQRLDYFVEKRQIAFAITGLTCPSGLTAGMYVPIARLLSLFLTDVATRIMSPLSFIRWKRVTVPKTCSVTISTTWVGVSKEVF
jgi:hypothetical protein